MSDTFEHFLDDISRCFLDRDLALWQSRLILPFSIVTKDAPIILSDAAAVAENFDHYLTAMEVMQLDLVARQAVSFEDCHDGTWLGTFVTRLVSKGMLATEPYAATALLQRIDGRLRMSSMLNARGHRDWTGIEGR